MNKTLVSMEVPSFGCLLTGKGKDSSENSSFLKDFQQKKYIKSSLTAKLKFLFLLVTKRAFL